QVVTCTSAAAIPAGGASGFSLRTLVSQSAPNSLVNTATVTTAGDTNTSNDSATDRANVSRQDFRIVVAPTSLTLAPGATGSVVVSATRQDNFSLPIAVTFAQTPGLTFSPQSFSLTTGATQTVRVTVAADAVASTLDVTISGTSNLSGSVATRTAQLRVTIQIQADFDLVLSPTALRLVTGGAAVPVQVSVQGRNGFNGTVNVTAPSLSGVTFTPSTFTLAAGASQTVNVAALASTGTGMTNAVFSGTATGITGPRTASLALTIVSAGDFTIDLSPSGISAGQGASVTVNVAITPQNGFNGSVALVVSPSAGVTVTPSSFALTAGTSRSVSLSISTTAEPGQRTLTFTGTASGVEGPRQAELRLTINPPPPQIAFFRANPASITAGQDTELSWDTVNATSVTLSPGGSVALTGTTRVSPTQTTVYTLTARGSGGSATSQLTVEVCTVPAAPTNLRILPFGRQDAPVSATDYLILSWDLPVEGSLPTRYEYRINGDAWVSTTERLVVVPPRGNTQSIQLFVRAYACTPELGFGPEGQSAVVSLGAPIADFTMPPTAVAGAPVTITDISLPPATSWLWLYDDGSPASTTQSQVHTFPRAGTFSVTLIAINGSGASTKTRTIAVSAAAPAPAELRASPSTPLIEGGPGRFRSTGVRGELVVTSRSSREEIAYLRFLDARGALLYERRLVLEPCAVAPGVPPCAPGPVAPGVPPCAPGADAARYDLSAFGVEGASSIELVSGARLSGSVEER
ncbi:MAG: PKD domain-containing protein, partial [Acidobacteria bacterium]|nr:PKD domain-containing protein [Acidobacteriota bacterium]